MKDRKFIITGGPTREWLDPVRFISNPSSGKMGIALAAEAARVSGNVVFIHGPIDINLMSGDYRRVAVESTGDMLRAVMDELEPEAVLIMAAAPADYTPAERSEQKIKKSDGELTVRFARTPDILREVAGRRVREESLRGIFVAGFAAETTNLEEYALGKLRGKNLDMICLNDVGRRDTGFRSDTNAITVFTRRGERREIPLMGKREAAARIIAIIGELLAVS